MTASADNSSHAKEPEVEKKSDSRRRKAEPKRAEPSRSSDMNAKPDGDVGARDGAGQDSAGQDSAGKDSAASKALAPAGAIPLDPFLAAKAEDKVEPPAPPRSLASRMLDYSAHAAIIVGLIGFAWTVSGHVIGQKKADAPAASARSTAKPDEMSDLRLANIKLHEEVKALKSSVDALRTAARRDTTSEQVRVLSAGLESVKSNLGATRSEANTAIAQLQSKVDKLAPGKMQALADRVGRLEHQGIDTPSTGSIAQGDAGRGDAGRGDAGRGDAGRGEAARKEAARNEPPKAVKPVLSETTKTAPKPPVKPAEFAKLDDETGAKDDSKPTIIQGWVVRDVYQGVALVEGRHETLEVVAGVSIPGAGVVKSIERKGGGWVVTTSKGQLAYGGAAAQREQRTYRGNGYDGGRYGRGGYPSYRYDY